MKIFRIIARLNVGGPARHVVWLTRAFDDEEFQSVLVAGSVPAGEEDMAYFAAENGVTPQYISELSRELSPKDIVSLWKIYRSVCRFQPDIIHTHTAKAGTVGRVAAFLYRWVTWQTLMGRPRRVRVVHTFHGHVFHSYYGSAKTRLFITIERVLARLATDRIVAISDQQLGEIHGRFGVGRPEQFRVIPLGVDIGAYASAGDRRHVLRNETGARDDEIVVGFIGRLTAVKNISLLLRAAAKVRELEPGLGIRFVIIGDGELRGPLEDEAAALGLTETLTFMGNRDDIGQLLPGLDIVALTSLNEGTPLSLIEAMACGRPFVSTAVGGVADLAGPPVDEKDGFTVCDRGLLAEPGSARSVALGLIYLAKNEKLRAGLSGRGREFIAANYSTARLIGDLKALYRELHDR